MGGRGDTTGGPGPSWTGPVLEALCPGPGQVLSWTGVHTASPIGLWASASQQVEASLWKGLYTEVPGLHRSV